MKSWLRTWATPITSAVGLVMGVTGILMFFHIGPHIMEELHAWAGWLVLAAVGLHLAKNWAATKVYLRKRRALVISMAGTALAAGLFMGIGSMAEEGGGPSPRREMLQRVEHATLAELAPILGASTDALAAALAEAGMGAATSESTPQALAEAAGEPTEVVLAVLISAAQ